MPGIFPESRSLSNGARLKMTQEHLLPSEHGLRREVWLPVKGVDESLYLLIRLVHAGGS
jgi:hypothetical protein